MINKKEIKEHIEHVLRKKSGSDIVKEKWADIENGDVSPFFLALFGKRITLSAKVAQSYQTKFGMSLWEQISQKLAQSVGWKCETQYKLLGNVSSEAQAFIHSLLEDRGYSPDREKELSTIKDKSKNFVAEPVEYPDATVDIFIKTDTGTEICIDITTVKPNKKEFRTLKRKLLMWAAIRYSQDQKIDFQPYIAIPYNPNNGEYTNHSRSYDRLDLLVGNELWQKVSNNSFTIGELISIFEEIGDELKVEIEEEISNHN